MSNKCEATHRIVIGNCRIEYYEFEYGKAIQKFDWCVNEKTSLLADERGCQLRVISEGTNAEISVGEGTEVLDMEGNVLDFADFPAFVTAVKAMRESCGCCNGSGSGSVGTEEINFNNLTNTQITQLSQIIDFSQLTATQIQNLTNAIDFCSLTSAQIICLMGALDFSLLNATQITQLTQVIDFSQLTTPQVNALTQVIDFTNLSNQQVIDLTAAIDFCLLSVAQINCLNSRVVPGAILDADGDTGIQLIEGAQDTLNMLVDGAVQAALTSSELSLNNLFIDGATGLDLVPQAANPGSSNALWVDSAGSIFKGTSALEARHHHLPRANNTQGVAPTAGEKPIPVQGDTATVVLANGVEEGWTYDSGAWNLDYTRTPTSVDGNLHPVDRADAVQGVAPTVAEVASPVNGDVSQVFLTDGVIEYWSHNGTSWSLTKTVSAPTGQDGRAYNIDRTSNATNVSPTTLEVASPKNGDTATISRNGEGLEFWSYSGGSWSLDFSFVPPVDTNYANTSLVATGSQEHTWADFTLQETFGFGSRILDWEGGALLPGATRTLTQSISGLDENISFGVAGTFNRDINSSGYSWVREAAGRTTVETIDGAFRVKSENLAATTGTGDLDVSNLRSALLYETDPVGDVVGVIAEEKGTSGDGMLRLLTQMVAKGTGVVGGFLRLNSATGEVEFEELDPNSIARDKFIVRGDSVASVAPTALEFPSPAEESTAEVFLANGNKEHWEFTGGTWSLVITETPVTLSNDGNHTPIDRANSTQGVAPTAVEVPSPVNGDSAEIFLNDGTREYWLHNGTTWNLIKTLTSVPSDRYAQNFAPGDWTIVGTDAVLTIPQATHTRGVDPVVTLKEVLGSGQRELVGATIQDNAAGDVTITIDAAALTNTRVIIL